MGETVSLSSERTSPNMLRFKGWEYRTFRRWCSEIWLRNIWWDRRDSFVSFFLWKFLGIGKKVNDFLASLIPFYYLCTCLAVDGWHWDADQEKKVHGLAYHNKKDVCFTFSSDSSKPRKFHRAFSGRQRWASTHRVYLHYGIGVLFSFVWRGCILCRTQNIYPLA